jgi:hypothetical protein
MSRERSTLLTGKPLHILKFFSVKKPEIILAMPQPQRVKAVGNCTSGSVMQLIDEVATTDLRVCAMTWRTRRRTLKPGTANAATEMNSARGTHAVPTGAGASAAPPMELIDETGTIRLLDLLERLSDAHKVEQRDARIGRSPPEPGRALLSERRSAKDAADTTPHVPSLCAEERSR